MARNLIVLAVDGSTHSRSAVRHVARSLSPAATGSALHLLHVQQRIPPRAATAVGRRILDTYYRTELTRATAIAQRLLDAHEVAYRSVRRIGQPGAEIARYATEERAALVAMGSHGLGASGRLLLGSTTQTVIGACKVPVLVVRAAQRSTAGGALVVAVDGSPYTRRIIAYLIRQRELLRPDGRIVLLHVAASGVPAAAGSERRASRRQEQAGHERAFAPARRLLAKARLVWREVRAHGDPARQIAACADRHDAEMIVLGSHGRGTPRRLFLGAVAQKTINASRSPVLIVR